MIERWQYQPEAREEVVEAARYYEEQRSGLGDEFLEAFERMLLDADAAPERAARHPEAPRELGLRRLRMSRFPYVVVFFDEPSGHRIVAVAHVRREPMYWLSRAQRR